MSTDALMVEGAVPLDVSSDNHDCVFEAVQVNVPSPVLLIARACDAGFALPAVALNVREVGATVSTGTAVTVSVTGTVMGELPAPVAVMVMVSW